MSARSLMMSQTGRITCVAVIAAAASVWSPATGYAEVAIEMYDGARPDEAASIMPIVHDELGSQGVLAAPRQVKVMLRYPPRPLISDPTVTSAGLADELELGVKAYLRGEYEGAIVKLKSALARASANPGAVVAAENTRTSMARALVGLALSYNNAGKANEAVETMTTYLRSTNVPVLRKMLGPPGEQLYNQVRKSLEKIPRGSLIVNVKAPAAQIFLNALRIEHGALLATDLLPGDYHVIVLVGQTSRRYVFTIRPEMPTTLDIDWAFDSALQLSDQWVGVALAPGAATSEYVRGFARRMGNRRRMIVLGLRRERNHIVLVGTNYGDALTGHITRAGEAHVLSAGDESKLRALARFLATGESSPDVFAVGQRAPSPPSRWPAIPLAAAAVAGLGGGIFLLSGGEQDVPTVVGSTLLLSGGVLAGLGAVWFVIRRPPERVPTMAFLGLRRSGAVVTLGWSF